MRYEDVYEASELLYGIERDETEISLIRHYYPVRPAGRKLERLEVPKEIAEAMPSDTYTCHIGGDQGHQRNYDTFLGDFWYRPKTSEELQAIQIVYDIKGESLDGYVLGEWLCITAPCFKTSDIVLNDDWRDVYLQLPRFVFLGEDKQALELAQKGARHKGDGDEDLLNLLEEIRAVLGGKSSDLP